MHHFLSSFFIKTKSLTFIKIVFSVPPISLHLSVVYNVLEMPLMFPFLKHLAIFFLLKWCLYKGVSCWSLLLTQQGTQTLLPYADHPNCRPNTEEKNNNLLSAELAVLHIKGPIETARLHCHQTLILAFLPGSDSNLRLRLNLSPGLSCLDMSVRLGQSGECWQGACHCWHFSKPHLDWKPSANSR